MSPNMRRMRASCLSSRVWFDGICRYPSNAVFLTITFYLANRGLGGSWAKSSRPQAWRHLGSARIFQGFHLSSLLHMMRPSQPDEALLEAGSSSTGTRPPKSETAWKAFLFLALRP